MYIGGYYQLLPVIILLVEKNDDRKQLIHNCRTNNLFFCLVKRTILVIL